MRQALKGKVAVVTGATRGAGRGRYLREVMDVGKPADAHGYR
jgi:hypothetical protein